MTTYDVEVERDGRWWMIHVPAIDGLTQARRLSEAREMAVDFISVDQGIPAEEVDVRLTALRVDGHDYLAARRRVGQLRQQLADLEAELAAEQRRVARELVDDEVPLRDVGEVLGVSFQRVHQLVS